MLKRLVPTLKYKFNMHLKSIKAFNRKTYLTLKYYNINFNQLG